MRKLAVVAMACLLAGCSQFAGGSGEFTVEGATYQAERIRCERQEKVLTLLAESGDAALLTRMTDSDHPEVREVQMGAKGSPPLLSTQDGGSAQVVRTGNSFELSGTVLHTSASMNAAPGTKEEFTAVITCNTIDDVQS